MRWNIVIGGQLLSKSLRGLRSCYTPALFDREGVLVAIALFIAPFVLLWIFDRVLPIEPSPGREPPAHAPQAGRRRSVRSSETGGRGASLRP